MRTVEIPGLSEIREEITGLSWVVGEVVQVRVRRFVVDENGDDIGIQLNDENFDIVRQDLDELLAADDESGKPAGVFRKDDTWKLIDKIRSRGGPPPFINNEPEIFEDE